MTASKLSIFAHGSVDDCLNVAHILVLTFAIKDPANHVGKPFSTISPAIVARPFCSLHCPVVQLHQPADSNARDLRHVVTLASRTTVIWTKRIVQNVPFSFPKLACAAKRRSRTCRVGFRMYSVARSAVESSNVDLISAKGHVIGLGSAKTLVVNANNLAARARKFADTAAKSLATHRHHAVRTSLARARCSSLVRANISSKRSNATLPNPTKETPPKPLSAMMSALGSKGIVD